MRKNLTVRSDWRLAKTWTRELSQAVVRRGVTIALAVVIGVALPPVAAADDVVPDWQRSDITELLQALIDEAPAEGRTIILRRDRPYRISNTIVIDRDDIELAGVADIRDDGSPARPNTILRANTVWHGDATVLIALLGVRRCVIRDLLINGNCDDLGPDGGQYGILLSGTDRCRVDNCEVRNLGHSREHPGGSHITLMATELDDVAPIPRLDRTITIGDRTWDLTARGHHSRRNEVVNCFLDDLTSDFGLRASFGVRILTAWTADKAEDEYEYSARNNVVRDNVFRGFFDSALEIGGPASYSNLVTGNVVQDGFQTSIEADKGAFGNDFEYNIVRRQHSLQHVVGMAPDEYATAGARSFAFRDQGFAREGFRTRFASGNRFRWNMVGNVRGRTSIKTGMILLNRSRSVVVRGNVIDEIGLDHTLNSRARIGIVVMDHEVTNAKFVRAGGEGTNVIPESGQNGETVVPIRTLPDTHMESNSGRGGFRVAR